MANVYVCVCIWERSHRDDLDSTQGWILINPAPWAARYCMVLPQPTSTPQPVKWQSIKLPHLFPTKLNRAAKSNCVKVAVVKLLFGIPVFLRHLVALYICAMSALQQHVLVHFD